MSIKYIVCIVALLFHGCVQHKTKDITKKILTTEKWIQIYREEINIAVVNKDVWAIHFFQNEVKYLLIELEQIKKGSK
jgi:hypothetical protein